MSRPPHLRLVEGRTPQPAPTRAEPPPQDGPPHAEADEAALRAEIAALEGEIEGLAARVETCRKLARLALGLTAGGAALLVLLVLGAFGQAPGLLILGLCGLLGGLALGGTNAATRDEATETLRAEVARRDELVGWLDLRLVPAHRMD